MNKTELAKLERFLRRTFSNQEISVKPRAKSSDTAVYVGENDIGIMNVDDEEGERSFELRVVIPAVPAASGRVATTLDKSDLATLERVLRQTFSNHALTVKARVKLNDSAEVYIGEEYIGILYVDNEDGKRSFELRVTILTEDLDG